MDDAEWKLAMEKLERAAESVAVLSRCLGVSAQLEHWRAHHDDLSGVDAANALDQAAGLLEQMANGHARQLLDDVEALLKQLPAPWE